MREEAVVGRRGGVVVPDLGLPVRSADAPGAIAHRDAVDVHLLAVEREAPGDAPGLVDVRAEVERRFLARQQRRAQRLERDVERHLVVVGAEAVHAAELVALEEHALRQVVGVEQVGGAVSGSCQLQL